jgi:outer membrane protein assembly factor BamB
MYAIKSPEKLCHIRLSIFGPAFAGLCATLKRSLGEIMSNYQKHKLAKLHRPRLASATSVVLAACLYLAAQSNALASDVVTYHNDNARTGRYSQETILTPSNVRSGTFGKLFIAPVDGVIDAQPLYLSAVPIRGIIHNVVYAVTENDSLFAVDGDTGERLWRVSALKAGESPSDTLGCTQITPTIGITSTPVIDRSVGSHGTIYFVAMSKTASTYFQRIHALDVSTGREEFGGPVDIAASYPGTGDNSKGGFVIFDPEQYAERQGLLLLNGTIYTAWTSHCDQRPYTGWIIGYSKSSLARTAVLNVTPNGTRGAIWQSGAGMASDGSSIYCLDANGTFDTTLNSNGFPSKGDYGNALMKLGITNGRLTVVDYFNMYNTVSESGADLDLGSGGALVLPPIRDSSRITRHLVVGAGKDGNIYLVDRSNMGKFDSDTNRIYQDFDSVLGKGVWSMPAYFNRNLYFGPKANHLLQFRLSEGEISMSLRSRSAAFFEYPGSTPSVSANGATDGIVWAIEHSSPSILHAYNATSLRRELYNSNQAASGADQFGDASRFGTPIIANGKVYVGTTSGVAAFGLLH